MPDRDRIPPADHTRIAVENAQPVEFGQVLFELEPLAGRPLDAG